MKMDIEDIKKVNLNPGETLVVQIDTGQMPPQRTNKYLNQVADAWKELFPNNQVIVINKSTALTVIGNESGPPLNLNLEDCPPPICQSDYERAMGVIK
jgi:hypothetical protein